MKLENITNLDMSRLERRVANFEGLDLHRLKAAEIYRVSVEAVTDEQRRVAKAENTRAAYSVTGRLLTEMADYNEPGSWGRMSEGWPEVRGDEALALYRHAVVSKAIPYGAYVLMDERGHYGATESRIRVHPEHIATLKQSLADAKAPPPGDLA